MQQAMRLLKGINKDQADLLKAEKNKVRELKIISDMQDMRWKVANDCRINSEDMSNMKEKLVEAHQTQLNNYKAVVAVANEERELAEKKCVELNAIICALTAGKLWFKDSTLCIDNDPVTALGSIDGHNLIIKGNCSDKGFAPQNEEEQKVANDEPSMNNPQDQRSNPADVFGHLS